MQSRGGSFNQFTIIHTYKFIVYSDFKIYYVYIHACICINQNANYQSMHDLACYEPSCDIGANLIHW